MNLVEITDKAKHSGFYLWMLNFFFDRMVPFNLPHKFRITYIGDSNVKTLLPYRKRNLNHVKGLHACALATLTEMTSGFMLAVKLDPTKFRLILRRLEIDYMYQGKMDAVCEFSLTPEWMKDNIYDPLSRTDSVDIIADVKIFDVKGNQLTLGKAHWQVKPWAKVRTKA
jgi:acyl-coenzyme A thioesterase PaaI-like protein